MFVKTRGKAGMWDSFSGFRDPEPRLPSDTYKPLPVLDVSEAVAGTRVVLVRRMDSVPVPIGIVGTITTVTRGWCTVLFERPKERDEYKVLRTHLAKA